MKQTFKFWIYAQPRGSEVIYALSDLQWGDWEGASQKVLVTEHTITLELPELSESTPAIVEALEKKKEEMKATASAAIAEVDAQIQSLLAITNEVEA